jgi:hypothetical protein
MLEKKFKHFNTAIRETKKLLQELGPLSANEIKHRLSELDNLKTTRVSSHRISQFLRRKPFVVVDELPNKTKIYDLMEE